MSHIEPLATSNDSRGTPYILHSKSHQIPAEICVLVGTCQGQESLSLNQLPRAEQEQQICSVDELKTNKVVSVFLAIEQLVYSQDFFPEPNDILNDTRYLKSYLSKLTNSFFHSCNYLLLKKRFVPNKFLPVPTISDANRPIM